MPSRFAHYDSDEERLPQGMTRIGYDADTQVYTYRNITDGSIWEGNPGSRYGELMRVGNLPTGPDLDDPSDATRPFLVREDDDDGVYGGDARKVSWRQQYQPLLTFFLIISIFLISFIWFLHRNAAAGEPVRECMSGWEKHKVVSGDTCWNLSQERGIKLDDVLEANNGLDCDRLKPGAGICLPNP